MAARTALITGANRGIGLEVCRQLARQGMHVILTGRSGPAVSEAAQGLRNDGLDVRAEVLDVSSEESVVACATRLEEQRSSDTDSRSGGESRHGVPNVEMAPMSAHFNCLKWALSVLQ
jgi:NAD(P)-dependent dehydrogenase (short-subunit alcohol dehydrogenase family)